MNRATIGVLGGGQLGRMLVEAANRLNINIIILDQGTRSPAKQLSNHGDHIDGKFTDTQAIKELASRCDIITIEIEHVNVDALKNLKDVVVEPGWRTIEIIQDKFTQKEFLLDHDIPVARSVAVQTSEMQELEGLGKRLGYPFMLKSRREAYDGRGNYAVTSKEDIPKALEALSENRALYAEKWARFKMELAVMVVKTRDATFAFPTVETVHEDSICKLVYAPARHPGEEVAKRAQELAKKAIGAFEGRGVFGVEMFLLEDDSLLVNEIAPRPHNSGHYTIEACYMSQYEAHLRALLDWPIHEKSLQLRTPAVMLNILGGASTSSHLDVAKKALDVPRCQIHLYGKGEARPGRKMGHATVTAPTMSEAETLIQPLIETVDKIREERGLPPSSAPSQISSAALTSPPAPASSSSPREKPLVGIIMGSDSDLPKLRGAIDTLTHFRVPHEVHIKSAHRTHHEMTAYASTAASRGLLVIIAAAGGAAHLPGMTASATPLPVIGIPIKRSLLDGVDSLYSINEMPRGVPVATVGIDNAVNAALLAVRILGTSDRKWVGMMEEYMETAAEEVREKDRELARVGALAYLEKMGKQ